MDRHQLISVFFLSLLLYVSYQILRILSPFTAPLFWAAILAFAFYPLYRRIRTKLGNREFLAAVLTLLLILISLLPLFLFGISRLIYEVRVFYDWITYLIQSGEAEIMIQQFVTSPWMEKIRLTLGAEQTSYQQLTEGFTSSAGALTGAIAEKVTAFTTGLLIFFMKFILGVLFLAVFLKDGRRILRFIYQITPLEENTKRAVFDQIEATFSAVIHGQLLSAFIQSLFAAIIFSSMQLPFAILLAIAIFFCALIPFMGAPVVWFPMVLFLFLQQEYIQAMVLLILCLVFIGSVDNIVHPIFIGNRTRLPYLLLFLGIMGGILVYGVMGIFVGPTLLSLFFVLVEFYRKRFASPADDTSRMAA